MCCGELSCPCGAIAGICGKTGILMGIFLLDHNFQKKNNNNNKSFHCQ